MIVLASASPRRHELLSQAGVPFERMSVDLDESVLPGEAPIAYVRRLAEAKARAVADTVNSLDYCVIGADTTVVCEGQILGKPADAGEANAMLELLSGRWHEVTTGYCLLRAHDCFVEHTTTRVEMRPISPRERSAYVECGEWQGKAGGYAIQGIASALVRQISGSYSNVVGLPVCEVIEALQRANSLPPDWRLGGSK